MRYFVGFWGRRWWEWLRRKRQVIILIAMFVAACAPMACAPEWKPVPGPSPVTTTTLDVHCQAVEGCQ